MSRLPWPLVLLCLLGCSRRVSAPVPVPRKDPTDAWAELVGRAATPDGLDYALLEEERATLDSYVAWIGIHGPFSDELRESAEDRRLAYMINACNAATVYGVLSEMPLGSVQDLRFGIWRRSGSAFFHGLRFRVDQNWTSLSTLAEQDIVNRFQEPLLHVALTQASRGSPPLRFWEEYRLQRQLEAAMKAFVDSDRGVRRVGQGWAMSELFRRHEDDFLDWSVADSICEWLSPFATGERRGWLEAHAVDCPIESFPFDWSLNEADAPEDQVAPARQTGPQPKLRRPKNPPSEKEKTRSGDSGG